MKRKNFKLNVYLSGIICLIFVLFLFWPNSLMAQDEVVLTEFIDNSVRCVDSTAAVDLSWTSTLTGNPTYYILRKIEEETIFTEIDNISSNLSTILYTESPVDSDKTYVYQIRAKKGSNIYYSNHATTTKKAYCPSIFLPSESSCHPGPYVNLSWSSVSGDLDEYWLYRKGSGEDEFSLIKILAETSYEDGPDIIGASDYYYYVKSFWQDGASVFYSPDQDKEVPVPACEPTLAVSGSCLDTAPGGPVINLSWNKLLGVQRYQVYRQALGEADFSLLAEIFDEEVTNYGDKLVESLPDAYYNSGNINYKVKAVWETVQRDSNVPLIDIPRCPPFLSITNNCDSFSFNLKWTATQGNNVIYNIYRNGVWQYRNDGITNTSYEDGLDEAICPGEICDFNYRIEAIVNVIDILSSDTVPTSINCTAAVAPSPAPILNEPTISCFLGTSRVYLSWSASDNVTYYTVYRASEGATSELITSATEYFDTVEAPYDYTYRVTAFGKGGHIDGPNVYTITAINCSTPLAPTLTLTTDCNSGVPFINLFWTETANTYGYDIYKGLNAGTLPLLIALDSSILQLSDNNTDPSTDYYYQVIAKGPPAAEGEDPIQSESEIQSVATYSCAPTTPSLTLDKVCISGNPVVDLAWSTDHENTDSYEIFREDIGLVKTIYPTDTIWQDDSVGSETAYNYRIEAIGPTGLKSIDPASGYKSITTYSCGPPGDFTLSDPTPPYCQGSYPRADLSWTNSSNADSYDITRFNNTTAEETTISDKTSVFTDWGLGNALDFDGSNDYVYLDSVNPTSAITVEAWVKSGNTSGYSAAWQIVSKYSAYILGTDSVGGKNMCFIIYDTGWRHGSCYNVPDPQNWHHFVGMYDSIANVKKIYVDGMLRDIAYPSGSIRADTGPIHIGHREGYSIGTNHFKGVVDEVRIYGRALTLTEVQEHYQGIFNNENGLAGLWHFDEGSGSSVSDSSNNGNNGTLVNMEANSWIENGLQTGENYNWQATAFGVGGQTNSNLTAPITFPDCPPTKPGLVLSMGCSGADVPTANLSWSYSYGATSFKIYREGAVNPIETFTLSDPADPEFSTRDWTDNNEGAGLTDETVYTYWVEAIGPGGQTESDHLPVTTYNCSTPAEPENLVASFFCGGTGNSYPRISLDWLEPIDADNYTVYRYDVANNQTATTDTIINFLIDDYGNGVRVNTNYQYTVRAYSSGGTEGGLSNIAEIPVGNFCTPSTLSITTSSTTCESSLPVNGIAWSDATDFNTTYYEIYRDSTDIVDLIGTVNQGILSYSDNDINLQSLTNYTYYVRAVGPAGNSPDFASESIATYSCGIQPVAPTLILGPVAPNPYCQNNLPHIDLSWDSVADAYSYNLYRENSDASQSVYSTVVSALTENGDFVLEFDGSDDYVSISSHDSLNPERITMEAWIYPTSYSSYGNIINKRNPTRQYILRLYSNTGRVDGYVYVNGGWRACRTPSNIVAPLNNWSHIAHTYNGAVGRVYVNGVEGCIYTYSGNINSSGSDLRIGAYSASSERFKGKIDEVRIYGRALSGSEIQDHYNGIYNSETELRGAWHFNEGSGDTAYDSSGQGNNGRLGSAVGVDNNDPSWTFALDKPGFVFPLQDSAIYKYKIKAMGVDTESNFSNEIIINTPSAPPCLNPPAFGLYDRCTDYHHPITILYWENQKNVTEYQVYKVGALFESKAPTDFISKDGFIKHWLLVGPYTYSNAAVAFNTDDIDELNVRPRAGETADGETWFDYFSNSSYINFNNIFSPNNNVISYAFAYIYSPIEQNVKLWIGSDDGVKAFLNGNQVHSNYTWRGASPDQDKIDITLSAGINTLLIKVQEGGGNWGFYARIVDASGNNILDNITTWDSAGNSADYNIKAKILEEESAFLSSDVTSTQSDCEPAKPDLNVTAGCESGISKLFLSWGADPNDLTQSYTVNKRRLGDSNWYLNQFFPVILDKTETAYIDSEVTSEITYQYYVTAVGKGISIPSDVISEEAIICYPAPDAPIIEVEPRCLGDYPRMEITWNETAHTIGFNIWRKNNTLGTDYDPIKSSLSPDTTSYSDRGVGLIANNIYEYKVEAVGAGEDNSKFSESSGEKTAIDCANIPPLTPILAIRLTDAYGHYAYASLAWIDSGNEKRYKVLRDGVEIAELVQGTADYNEDDLIINHVDETVSDNTAYVYVIRAVNDNDPGITDSDPETAIIPIARPGEFTLSISWAKDTEEALLSWTEAASTTSGGIVSYKVLRNNTTDFTDVEALSDCEDITVAPFECLDAGATLLERFYSAEATNFGGTTNSNTVDIITVILPTWKEVKP